MPYVRRVRASGRPPGSPAVAGWRAPFALALVGLLGVTLAASRQQPALPELEVKAAFVAKFPSFVSWPPESAAGREPTLCLSPGQPFRHLVDEYARQTRVAGRPLVVRQLRTGQSPDGCDAVFVSSVDHSILQRVRSRAVLTIGDEPGFCERGGIINLRVIDDRVRFEINLERARRVGLDVHSPLLALATRVHGGRR